MDFVKGESGFFDYSKIVKVLISFGADVNLQNNKGETPLHMASTIEMAKILIDAGADIYIPNSRGDLPYETARDDEIAGFIESLME